MNAVAVSDQPRVNFELRVVIRYTTRRARGTEDSPSAPAKRPTNQKGSRDAPSRWRLARKLVRPEAPEIVDAKPLRKRQVVPLHSLPRASDARNARGRQDHTGRLVRQREHPARLPLVQRKQVGQPKLGVPGHSRASGRASHPLRSASSRLGTTPITTNNSHRGGPMLMRVITLGRFRPAPGGLGCHP